MQTKKITAFSVFLFLVSVLTQFTIIQSAQAACTGIVYVAKGSAAIDPGGCNWADAYPELQDALKSGTLASGDEIWVTAGTYYPDEGTGQVNNDRNSTFQMINGVSIYGGFAGVETQRSQRDPFTSVTILSGEIGNIGNSLDNAYHVVTATSINSITELDGVTIRDGYANAGNDFGGGLYISASNGNLRFKGITLTNNYAGKGGGLASFVSSPALTRVVFSGNVARQYGGGIYNQDGSPSLLDVIFDNNQTQQQGGPGGGLYSTNSNPGVYTVAPVLTNVTFSNNSAWRRRWIL
jgi:predicted outer membrane repeat protein